MTSHRALLLCAFPALTPVLLASEEGAAASAPSGARSSPEAEGATTALFAWADVDGDGRLDLAAVHTDGRLQLLRSNADGRFEDVTEAFGLSGVGNASLALWEDYDGDGRLDLFVGARTGMSRLFHNDHGFFVDWSAASGLASEGAVQSAHWFDVDGDGRLDLHVVTSQANELYRGLEGGFFERSELPFAGELAVAGPALPAGAIEPGMTDGTPSPPAPSGPVRPGLESEDASGKLASPKSSRGSVEVTVVAQPGGGIQAFLPACAVGVRNTATGGCLLASSTPTLGRLYPITADLFVALSGDVGIGTTAPGADLDVIGTLMVSETVGVPRALLDTPPGSSGELSLLGPAGGLAVLLGSSPGYPDTGGVMTYGPAGTLNTFSGFVVGFPDAGASGLVSPASTPVMINTTVAGSGGLAGYSGTFSYFTGAFHPLINMSTAPGLGMFSSGALSVYSYGALTSGIDGFTGTVFGAVKAFVQPHPVDATKEIQYVSLEGPEHGVYFRGSGLLEHGKAVISVPESFRLVAREEGLTVQVTPRGPSLGLYVASADLKEIRVLTNPGGPRDLAFDFQVMGLRSALPVHEPIRENQHFALAPGTALREGSMPGDYRELMIRNGTLSADGKVIESTALRQGYRHEDGKWVLPSKAGRGALEIGTPRRIVGKE